MAKYFIILMILYTIVAISILHGDSKHKKALIIIVSVLYFLSVFAVHYSNDKSKSLIYKPTLEYNQLDKRI